MEDAALKIYKSILSYKSLEELIERAEGENLYIECKAPMEPRITREIRAKLAQIASGFSNTEGGNIIWGMSTTKHEQSGLDILTQIEPIGKIDAFAKQIDKSIPALTVPPILQYSTKVVKKRKTDTKGVAITHIPKKIGGPVQSTIDNQFYFRSGDEFVIAPYEMIKRLFAATEAPDLHLSLDQRIIEIESEGRWKIPIGIRNDSVSIAEYVIVLVEVDNPEACEQIERQDFHNLSNINPGSRLYSVNIGVPIHRGLQIVAGNMIFKMKKDNMRIKRLQLKITLYANKMVPRLQKVNIQLTKKGFKLSLLKEDFLY